MKYINNRAINHFDSFDYIKGTYNMYDEECGRRVVTVEMRRGGKVNENPYILQTDKFCERLSFEFRSINLQKMSSSDYEEFSTDIFSNEI